MENQLTVDKKNAYSAYAWQGKMYDPDLSITEIAERIRYFCKKQYPDCKFSITIQRYAGGQALHLALISAPYEVFDKEKTQDKHGNIYSAQDFQYAQLNQFLFKEFGDGYNNGSYLTKKGFEVMKFLNDAATVYNFDDSDAQSDYFHTNFYVHISIGRHDKPFTIKK